MAKRFLLICFIFCLSFSGFAQVAEVEFKWLPSESSRRDCVGSANTIRLDGAVATDWYITGDHSTPVISGNGVVKFTWTGAFYGANITAYYNCSGCSISTGGFQVYENVVPKVETNVTSVSIAYKAPLDLWVNSSSNGGDTPTYQWFVNDKIITGATGLHFKPQDLGVILENHDRVRVRMNSNFQCALPNFDDSDDILVSVSYPVTKPTVANVSVAFNTATTLTASGAGANEEYKWFDAAGNVAYQGLSFPTPVFTNHTTYFVAKYNTSSKTQGERVPQVVTVVVPDPPVPRVSTNTCAEKTLFFSGTPPSGIDWCWQGTNPTGLQPSAGSNYVVPDASGQVYYLRAKSNTGIWSNAVGISVTTDPVDITLSAYDPQNTIVQATHSISLLPGFSVPAGSPFTAKIVITGECNDRYNWSEQIAYDENGKVFSRSRTYMDGFGNLLQSQSVDLTNGRIWLSQPLYDNRNNPSAGTLPAPILENDFLFKRKFVTSASGNAYNANDFDNTPSFSGELTNPNPVGKAPGTLGWYYSSNNTLEPATPITNFPYSRNYISPGPDPITSISSAPGDQYKMGGSHEVVGERQKIGINELWHYFATRAAIPDEHHWPKENPGETVSIGYKYITTDQDDKQSVTFVNADGQTLASATITSSGYDNWNYTFYDAAGQIVGTMAPEGINPPAVGTNFVTYFVYDNQGRLTETTSIDEGTSKFMYSADGKIRFSQSAQQRLDHKFSYTNYDFAGRPVELGEYTSEGSNTYAFNPAEEANTMPVSELVDKTLEIGQTIGEIVPANYANVLGISAKGNSDHCHDYSFIVYDEVDGTSEAPQGNNLVGQVSKTQNNLGTTWYSYDEFGQIEWTKQLVTGLGTSYQTINYEYDYFGNVTSVLYQVDQTKFFHFYEYDENQRLTKVYTSRNGIKKQLEASYTYYLHGPLKRIELANNLQGIDYVYNIDGSLKLINHADPNLDPGADGMTGEHAGFMKDIFGETLDYNTNDYTGADYDEGNLSLSAYSDQFGGAVKAIRWHNRLDGDSPKTYAFTYDDQYQMIDADFGNMTGNEGSYGTDISPTHAYKEGVGTYSKNGNIKSLNRNGQTGNALAEYTYEYENNTTNRLHVVKNNGNEFLTYLYDASGRMIRQTEKIDASNPDVLNISYDPYGNIVEIKKNSVKLVAYTYDDRGNRALKTNYDEAGNVALKSFYIYDASGNVLAIYEQEGSGTLELVEIPIYGVGRIGIHKQAEGITFYEVPDHLGNVRGVIGKPSTLDVIATMEDNGQATMSNPRVQEMAFFKNLASTAVSDPNMNHSEATSQVPNPSYSSYLKWQDGVADGDAIGPAIGLKVEAGDVIDASVWAKYKKSTPSFTHDDIVAGMASTLGGNYVGTARGLDVLSTATQIFQNGITSAVIATANNNESDDLIPYAYLYYVLYDRNFVPIPGTGARQRVTALGGFSEGNEAFSSHEQISLPTINVTSPGYIYIFVSNESENTEVWFDDLHVIQQRSNFVTGADYYPFGLPLENRQVTREDYRYDYQGQFSEKDLATGWNEFELRMYDANIGRWINPDPYGQMVSPYLAYGNNPSINTDPDGGWCCGDFTLNAAKANAQMVIGAASTTLDEITVTATRLTYTRVLPALSTFAASSIDFLSDTPKPGETYGGLTQTLIEVNKWNPIAYADDGLSGLLFGTDRLGNQITKTQSGVNLALALPIGRLGKVLTYGERFIQASPWMKKFVGKKLMEIHHRIPQLYVRLGLFNESMLTSLSNLQAIPRQVHRKIVTPAWNRFAKLNPNPTAAEVMKFAIEMDKKIAPYINRINRNAKKLWRKLE
ncbi:MAG TPA: RHS repeat-associated core domain-containing protein [Chryseolinea sp.]